MSARPFRVESMLPLNHGGSGRWGWVNTVGSMKRAREEAEWRKTLFGRSRHYAYRVVNLVTNEVISL